MFNVWSKKNKCAAASLEAVENGVHIFGVVYEVPDHLISREASKAAHRTSMDQIEGEGHNYYKTPISLILPDRQSMRALTYLAKAPKSNIQTSRAYAEHIMAGLEEHKMPAEYREYVKARIIFNQPKLIEFFI